MATVPLRRTRIVCISDTHNYTFKLPHGDVLIHAGDLTNQGSFAELLRTVKWLEDAEFEAKIIIAGNHDITLDEEFYNSHGEVFHNKNKQSPADCIALLTNSPTLTYLCHEAATIRLTSPSGPHTEFTIFGSPYSPRYGLWAFYYDGYNNDNNNNNNGGHTVNTSPENCDLASHSTPSPWSDIPLETDIVVTHTPPRSHCDSTNENRPLGCEALRQALWRIRPRLAVSGHIHDGRGAKRVRWDLEKQLHSVPYAEKSTSTWEDPGLGNNKLSLVDLTGRKKGRSEGGGPVLDNDGSHPSRHRCAQGLGDQLLTTTTAAQALPSSSPRNPHLGSSVDVQGDRDSIAFGRGTDSAPSNYDYEALAGRLGRRETAIINAAIMKSRHPHIGGKQFNKPIVVDIYLPVWKEDEIGTG